MNKINIPIGFKLITITSLILLTSLVGTNYIAGTFFQRDTTTRIQEVTADKSRLLSLKVQADVSYIISQVRLISNSLLNDIEQTGTYTQAEMKTYRLEILRNFEQLFYVAIYHKSEQKNILVKDQVNPQNNVGIVDVELFRAIGTKGKLLASPPLAPFIYNVSPRAGISALALVFPLERDGLPPGYFALTYINTDIFTSAINTVSEYETYIVNHRGDLLGHRNTELLRTGVNFRNDEIVQEMLKSPINNGQMSYKNTDGTEEIGSFFKIELASLGVISTAERERILQAVYQIRRRNYYITGIVLLLSVMIIYLFAKTLSNPIRRLVAAAREIEQGHFRLNIKPSSRDEIGQLTLSFAQMGKGLDERDRMKNALGKFVNEEIANLALQGELSLGGERKDAAVFFSDIRSFTAISEKLTPEEVVEFLNEYMTVMVACVEATHGVVDKFIGDAVMAVWGAPISHGNDTEHAINSALMMRHALARFNQGRGGEKKPIIKIGCGINTGPLISGQIGSENRMEYTVIGDAVNLASRIEGLTKPFGTDILISEASYLLIQGVFYTAEMPPIMVKGKSDPIKIYAVLGRCDDANAYQNITQLRKYLGTEDIDLSQFDGKAKEEKFRAIKQTPPELEGDPAYLEKTSSSSSIPQIREPEFMVQAKLIQPRPINMENHKGITTELISLRESVLKQVITPEQARQRFSKVKQNLQQETKSLSPRREQKANVDYFQKLVHLKTTFEAKKISAEDAGRELEQLKKELQERTQTVAAAKKTPEMNLAQG